MTRLLAVCIAALALFATAGSATAKSITKSVGNERGCEDHGVFQVARGCDPGKKARNLVLTLGSKRVAKARNDASILNAEPLLPGETVTLSWKHPSKRAELILTVHTPTGERQVILLLYWRPSAVAVTAQENGSLRVVTPTRTAMIPANSATHVDWTARTPKQAATRVISALKRVFYSEIARLTYCAALHPDIAAGYRSFPGGDPLGDRFSLEDPLEQAPCGRGDFNTRVRYSAIKIRTSGNTAVLSAKTRKRKGAPAKPVSSLLVLDSQGLWRLATPQTLDPFFYRRPRSKKVLLQIFEKEKAQARDLVSALAKFDGFVAAATVPLNPSPPCTATLVPDPSFDVYAGDISDQEVPLARRQEDHAGSDLLAAGASGTCLVLRTRGQRSPAAAYRIGREGDLTIYVDNGRLVVFGKDDLGGKHSLPGAAGYVDANNIVLQLPAPFSFADTLGIDAIDLYRKSKYYDHVQIGN